ncbi:GGDEF domain-containing protein [Solwaraspora sp. WMMD1047]|uniref:GGDEF domain-containing protein n=1 Tax=Solwaraspora sp. WMMD1047 TaxID=3016102 RepID=UPI002417E3A7|nr:GGDEF domain-containing protein [Solwaraspora sp. WMMD1047]MDG4834157.1 GGDEF domain-containing protein [Solwaraspora sp. WMMD1047]
MSQTANSLITAAGGLLAGLTVAGLWALRLWTLLTRARTRQRTRDDAVFHAYRLVETLRVERDRYHRQATHDDTTGLPNRRAAIERLTQAVKTHDEVGVIVLDLVHFKLINDRLGHRAGNTLLSQVAERLHRLTRSDVFAARLSGDEFTLIIHGGADTTAAVAERTWRHISQVPFLLAGRQIDIVASVGHTTTEQAGRDPESLLHLADIAMYQAKANGGVHRYEAHMGDTPSHGRPRDWPPPPHEG